MELMNRSSLFLHHDTVNTTLRLYLELLFQLPTLGALGDGVTQWTVVVLGPW